MGGRLKREGTYGRNQHNIVIILQLKIKLKKKTTWICLSKKKGRGFPGGSVAKNPPADAGDTGRAYMLQHNQAREPELPEHEHLEAVLSDKKNPCNEKPEHGN